MKMARLWKTPAGKRIVKSIRYELDAARESREHGDRDSFLWWMERARYNRLLITEWN